jgi:hypothetical protein
MTVSSSITLQTEIRTKDPRLPAYIIVPSSLVTQWNLAGPTIIEGSIDGYETGRRALKPVTANDTSHWFLELTLPFCRIANIKVGETVNVTIHLATIEMPPELEIYLARSPSLRARWGQLSEHVKLTSQEHILSGKTEAIRESRAAAIVERLTAPV